MSGPPGTVATSLPVSLAALAGKLPSSTTISQPGGRVTLVQSTRPSTVTTQPVRTIPGQVVSVQRPAASRTTNLQTGAVSSFPGAVTVARAGATPITGVISSGSPVTNLQTGTNLVVGKTVGNAVASTQVTPKVAPTPVVSSTAVSGTKVVPTSQMSSVLNKTKTVLTTSAPKPPESQAISTPVTSYLSTTPAQQIGKSVATAQVATVGQSPAVAQSAVKEQTPVASKAGDGVAKGAAP